MNKICFFLLLLICSLSAFAQNAEKRTVKGHLVDVTGAPVMGASIMVKNSKQGTMADMEGNFALVLPAKEVKLTISFIGFKTKEISVAPNQNSLTVVMQEDSKQLDEIVVIGYGTQKKSSLTSSVETLKGDDLLKMAAVNVDQALVGQVAGLQVRNNSGDPSSGREADIRIRGIQGAPLLVIDGVPRFGNNTSDGEMRLSDLNPDDIESVSILKDAAAAAVYGARAANGVILVKTKRGGNDSRTRVDYRGQLNVQQATKLPKFLNSYEFAKLYNKAVESTGNTNYKEYTPEQLEAIRTHSNPNLYGDDNMLDYLDKFGYSTIHSLSISGGNSGLKYYTSLGYSKTKGLYGGVGRDRYNYAVKLDAKLTKGLTLAVDISGSRSENKNTSYATLDAAYNFSPLQTLRLTDGSLASINGGNPLVAVEGTGGYVQNKANLNTITAQLNYEFEKVKGLSMYLRGTFDNNTAIIKNFNSPTSLYLYNDQTKEINLDPLTVYPKSKISLQERSSAVDNKLLEFGVNFSRTFGAKHQTSGLLVVNYQDYKNRFIDGTNNDLPGIYPEIIGTASDAKLNGNESLNERASMIGRLNYGFDNRYFIEGSFRVDGSTKFSKDNRWGFFPTVSGSWVVTNEPFFKNWEQNIVSNVKFRGSMGVLGRDSGIGDYSYLYNYIYVLSQGYNIGGIIKPGTIMDTSNFPNPDLSWEKSKDFNFATDLGFWGNRFGLSYEYYCRYRTNMITFAPSYLYPPSTGTGGNVPNVNFGKIKAWGWDLTLNHKNTINKLKYDLALTMSKTQDIVEDYGDESSILESQRRKGRSSMVWSVYEADGLFQSIEEIANHKVNQDASQNATLAPGDIKYKDQNGDNQITEADKIFVKNSSYPDLTFSFNIGLRYKGFFTNIMLQGVSGSNQMITDLYTLESGSLQRFQEYHLNESWSPTNPNAEYPRVKFAGKGDNNRKESTFWIKKCDYTRLKMVTIGYALQAPMLKKLKLSSASISLQGSNLFTWSSLKNMDPESLRGYPIQRSYGATLSLGF